MADLLATDVAKVVEMTEEGEEHAPLLECSLEKRGGGSAQGSLLMGEGPDLSSSMRRKLQSACSSSRFFFSLGGAAEGVESAQEARVPPASTASVFGPKQAVNPLWTTTAGLSSALGILRATPSGTLSAIDLSDCAEQTGPCTPELIHSEAGAETSAAMVEASESVVEMLSESACAASSSVASWELGESARAGEASCLGSGAEGSVVGEERRVDGEEDSVSRDGATGLLGVPYARAIGASFAMSPELTERQCALNAAPLEGRLTSGDSKLLALRTLMREAVRSRRSEFT